MSTLNTGHVLFTATNWWFGRLTSLFTGPPFHAGIGKDSEHVCDHTLFNSDRGVLKSGIRTTPWCKRVDELSEKGSDWAILGPPTDITLEQRGIFARELAKQAKSARYSVAELFLQPLDVLRNRRKGIYLTPDSVRYRRAGDIWKSGKICSKQVGTILHKMGMVPHFATYFSPAELYRYLLLHAHYKVVTHSEPRPDWIAEYDEPDSCSWDSDDAAQGACPETDYPVGAC